jgi:hypothetical protein
VAGAFPPTGPFTIAERWNGSHWTIQPTPTFPGIYDLDPSFVSCPTTFLCTAVGGYTNNGVKLTLAEQWHGSGHQSQAATGPSGRASRELGVRPSTREGSPRPL